MTKKKILKDTLVYILKIMLVIVLVILAFIIGGMVGYGVLGDGEPTDIFNTELWEHIFSFFKKPVGQ